MIIPFARRAMVTLAGSREVIRTEACSAERFDEIYLHCIKGEGLKHGFFSYPQGELSRFLLIRDDEALCAAWDDGTNGGATLMREFFEPFLEQPRELICCQAPKELIEAMAAAWQRMPDAHIGAGLLAPQIMVEALLGSGVQAAIRLREGSGLSFALIENGNVLNLFEAGKEEPAGDPYEELRGMLSREPEEISLDVFESPQAARAEDWALVPGDFQEGMVRFYCHTSPHLIILLGGREVRRFPLLSGRTTIGRDPTSDIVIDNLSVSRNHAIVTFADGVCTVEDAGSSNGTFVKGQRVLAPTPLADGEEAVIGRHSIRYLARALRKDAGAARGEDLDKTVFLRAPQIEAPTGKKVPILTFAGRSIIAERASFVIGTDTSCDLPLEGRGIRPRHAELLRDDAGQVSIRHIGGMMSATRVNGKKFKAAPLKSGDLLQIGSVLIRFHLRPPSVEAKKEG
jgi:pSer/pThr/pTyr-binding forkhead associated (FHA) protein